MHPCCQVVHNHGVDCLDSDSQVDNRLDRVSCFNGNRGICDYDADGSSIHGYAQQEDEPFSFPSAASCPWNLLKNATLLKESNNLERVGRHHLVQVGKLVLVRLRLRKEDFLTLLLRREYVHRLTEVAALEVAEKLHLTLRELMHWHECGLLGHTEPANQLVAYIWETGNSLKVITDALVEV